VHPLLRRRAAGLLLHPTSLPADGPIGDIGPVAHAFVRSLARAGQRWWQMLPVVVPGAGNSPYSAPTTFAGSPLLVSHELLAADGWVEPPARRGATGSADYVVAWAQRRALLGRAWVRWRERGGPDDPGFREFVAREREWLDDWALYTAIKGRHAQAGWLDWPAPLRDREPAALARAHAELAGPVQCEQFAQWVFDRQWARLREAAAAAGVGLVGDLPIFVELDSADAWAHREVFRLGPGGRPSHVAGVPPDAFSATGQRWGNPLYDWPALAATGYAWWVRRVRHALRLFDLVRLDHFIGFHRAWAIPADEPDARRGEWEPGPGRALFDALAAACGGLPFLAEDLGLLVPAVEALRDALGLPGMRVVQFAFDGDPTNPHLPANHPPASVSYVGTHDNDTAAGWLASLDDATRARVADACGRAPDALALVELALGSPATTAIVTAQDLLGLGSEARMNTPAVAAGNWTWRLRGESWTPALEERLARLTAAAGRA